MKILLLGFLASLCLCSVANLQAQDADLYDQAQVNAFNDSIVPGTVHIQGSGITDLTPLLKLKYAGNLRIRNTRLTQLAGLDSIKAIGGKLEIENNNELTNIDALHNLTGINKLHIKGNDELYNLNGLGGLRGSIDTIYLYQTELTQIDSLMGLSGDVDLIDIRQNELSTLDGLIGITGADKLIIHEGVSSIDGLYFMRQSRSIDLRLSNVYSLSALRQLNVSESIYIRSDISRLDAFYPVRSLESLTISNCKVLTDFSGLDSLKYVDHLQLHDLMVYTSDILDFSALDQLSGNIKTVSISDIKDLQDLSFLDDVNAIGSLQLENNASLRNLQGLDSLANLDNLRIERCGAMSSLLGFPTAEDSLGSLFLSGLENLSSLDALSQLYKVNDTYSFHARFNLERLGIADVDGLAGLTGRYGGLLKIISNDKLQNLDGLAGITELGYGVHIQDNPLLDSCCVLKNLLKDFEYRIIKENRPSCSWEEILKTDGVCYGAVLPEPDTTDIPETFSIVKLSPNPARDQVKILYGSPEKKQIQIRVLDLQGRSAAPNQNLPMLEGYGEVSLDLSRLNPGLYFVQMLAPKTGQIWKLILY